MCKVLINAGADVTGYALAPPTEPSLYYICGIDRNMKSVIGDIRDREYLSKIITDFRPEIVIHMAAQPIVRESYKDPVYTYETNVMGTVNILESIRFCPSVRSFVNVTTDKVYLNKEWEWGYRENDELNGFDPYSNSKSCSELVTASYRNSFFEGNNSLSADGCKVALSTCRAGNVIGGGDFAKDRIIPDCVKATSEGKEIVVRNPYSTRPYQHVLEPVMAYLLIAKRQYEDAHFAGSYNIGPDDSDCRNTGDLVELFCKMWNHEADNNNCLNIASWTCRSDCGPHEASFLKLDCSKVRKTFNWEPKWPLETAVEKTVEWSVAYLNNEDATVVTDKQIKEYLQT